VATTFWLRDTNATPAPSGTEDSSALPVGTVNHASGAATAKTLSTAGAGSGTVTVSITSLAQTSDQDGMFARFVSSALATQTIAAQDWTLHYTLNESNAAANAFLVASVYVWRPSDDSIVGYLYDSHTSIGAEAAGVTSATIGGSAVVCQAGDRVVYEAWYHAAQSMATAYTDDFLYNQTIATARLVSTDTLTFDADVTEVFTAAKFPTGTARVGPFKS
jgi:hypothetical protein